ncbi:MAG: PAS domain S-box protein, partial [Pseudomonadota bacterium]
MPQSMNSAAMDRALIDAANRSLAVIYFDADSTILHANDAFLAATGYSLEEIQGQKRRIFMHPEDAAMPDYAALWEDLRAGVRRDGEIRRKHKNGAEMWLSATYSPVRDENGNVTTIVKLARDVTDTKHARVEAAAVFDTLNRSLARIEFDPEGTIRTANDNFLAAMGYNLNEIVGRHHRIFMPPEDAEKPEYRHFWQTLAAGEFSRGEYRRLDKRGNSIWISATYNPVRDARGEVYKILKLATDITERKDAENALIDALMDVASGRMETRLGESVRGEYAELRTMFNQTVEDLAGRLRAVMKGSKRMGWIADAVSDNATNLASKTEEQMEALAGTSAAISAISQEIVSTDESAQDVDRQAKLTAEKSKR